jgi:AcrR family transcriptional regulator
MAETADAARTQPATPRWEQILDAATQVFAEKGFSRATVRDVARAAGIADGTIYIYFPSKTDLLIGILDRLNETNRRDEDLARGLSGDVKSFFAAYLAHRLSVLSPGYDMLRAVLPELLVNPELRDLYFERVIAPTLALGERYIAAAIEQGKLRAVDPALATRAISGLVLGLLVQQMLGDDYLAAHGSAIAGPLATLLFDGLLPDDEAGGERGHGESAQPRSGECSR